MIFFTEREWKYSDRGLLRCKTKPKGLARVKIWGENKIKRGKWERESVVSFLLPPQSSNDHAWYWTFHREVRPEVTTVSVYLRKRKIETTINLFLMLERLDFFATQFEYLEANGSKKLRMRKSKANNERNINKFHFIQYLKKKARNLTVPWKRFVL